MTFTECDMQIDGLTMTAIITREHTASKVSVSGGGQLKDLSLIHPPGE